MEIFENDFVLSPVKVGNEIKYVKYNKEAKEQVLLEKLEKEDEKKIGNISNNIILPSGPGVERDTLDLYKRIRNLLKRTLIFPEEHQYSFVALYILSTWVYDLYDYICYMQFRGLAGTGKTTTLDVCSNLCLNTFRGNGADTDAAVVRILDNLTGTLVIDEAQKSTADSTSTFHKMLSSGNGKNGVFNKSRFLNNEWEVQTFNIFGPKILGSRYDLNDEAIVSRTLQITLPFITLKRLRNADLLSLNSNDFIEESNALRNALLLYRQRRLLGEASAPCVYSGTDIDGLEFTTRELQVFQWLLDEAPTKEIFNEVVQCIYSYKRNIYSLREQELDSQVLLAAIELLEKQKKPVPLKMISNKVSSEIGYNITPKRVSSVLREHSIRTSRKSSGIVMDCSEKYLREHLEMIGLNPTQSA